MRVFVLVLVLVCGCCGCQKQAEKTPPVTQGFVCDADIHYGDLNVKALITRPVAGVCRVEIKEPAALSGMVLDLDGEKMKISYLGLAFDLSPKDMPDTSFAQALINALDSASLPGGLKLEKKDGGYVFSGQSDSGGFSIAVGPGGALKSLSIPALHLNIDFSNFKVN